MPKDTEYYNLFSSSLDYAQANEGSLSDESISKLQLTGDYLNQKSDYNNNIFESDSYYQSLKDSYDEQKTSARDVDLYGYEPTGNWLPDWVKAGYNSSLTGLSEQIATGRQRFNLGDYEPGMLEDIGATLVSFLMPADLATMVAGGGVAGFGARAAVKESTKKAIQLAAKQHIGGKAVSKGLVNNILNKEMKEATRKLTLQGLTPSKAKKVIDAGAQKVLHQSLISGAGGAGGLGFYSGLQSSLGQIADPDMEFDAVMALKDASKGAILGAVTAGTQPLVRAVMKPTTSTFGKLAQGTAVKAIETAEFGTLAPMLSGEAPTMKDYAHAAGVIGGLGAQRFATGQVVKGYRKIRDAKRDLMVSTEEGAKILADVDKAGIETKEVYTDMNGTRVRDVTFSKKSVKKADNKTYKEDIVNMRDAETGTSLEPITMREFQRRGFTRRTRGKFTPEKLENARRKNIFGLKDKLKLSNEEFRTEVDIARGEAYEYSKGETGYKSLSAVGKLKLLNQLRHRKRVSELKKTLDDAGFENNLLPKKYLGDMILAEVIPKGYRRSKNIFQTQFGGIATKKLDKANARQFTLIGEATQRLIDSGLFQEKFTKKLQEFVGIGKEQTQEKWREVANKLERGVPESDPMYSVINEYRNIMDWMWDVSKKAGINLGKKEANYFPRVIKQEYLELFSSEFAKLRDKNPQLFSDDSIYKDRKFQEHIGDIVSRNDLSPKMKSVLLEIAGLNESQTRLNTLDYNARVSKAFKDLNSYTNIQYHSVAKNLEVSRTADWLPERILERDPRLVLTRYANQWARRVAFVENFGNKGEVMKELVRGVDNLSKTREVGSKERIALDNESRTLNMLFEAYTNKIEMNPSYNWKTPWAKKVWSDITNFEIATKIGLGFATIPNVTQLAISTAVKAGYMPLIKGVYKLATNKKYRSDIKKSGVTQLSVYQAIAGLEPADSFMGKWAEGFTTVFGFKGMNKINQLVSAATAREWIGDLRKVATGKAKGLSKLKRKQWAIENLNQLGIKEYKNMSRRAESEAMYRFARDSQLQRNILEEPLIFNDPRFRPLFLFKKFGYKQFNWIKDQLIAEVRRGNVFPMLRLAVGGFFGGEFVLWAKEALGEALSGREVYDENELFLDLGNIKGVATGEKDLSDLADIQNKTWSDVVERFASVGSFGIVGDMVASENKIRALEFAAKPAIVQDFDKIWMTMTKTWENIGDYGGVGALKRMPKYIAPALGTMPRRVAERFKPEGQRKADTKRRKGIVKTKIFEYIIDGNDVMSARLIENWNRSYPENPIMYDDIDADAIYNFLKKKAERRANP